MNAATALRRSFERSRGLELEQQIQECVDQLQHPELIATEVLDAYRTVATFFNDEEPAYGAAPETVAVTMVEGYLGEARELMVLGDKCSFTCLATNVDPLAGFEGNAGNDHAPGLSTGLDYVGITCDQNAVLVLGAVQAPGDATAYPLLLRLLACLTEIAPEAQLTRLNEERFKGIADPERPFDLNLVLWDREDQPEATPLSQLTRDLAEKVKAGILDGADFPTRLGDIVCLRMNPDRFDGRMRFDWRV
jgi:hypothetical protein